MKKKSILFFSRSELSFLYGSLHNYLKDSFNLIHVAYSQKEAEILNLKFGIKDIIIFKDLTKSFLSIKTEQEDLELIDMLLMTQSNGNFNFNAMLQSNRSSRYIGYENSVQSANIYYKTWSKVFEDMKIDFFVHEPVSLMMNQIAAAVCKKHEGIYTTHILVHGDCNDYNFMMVDHYKGRPVELDYIYDDLSSEEVYLHKGRISDFLEEFRASYSVFFGALGNGKSGFKLQVKLGKSYIKQLLKNVLNQQKFDPVVDNVELFMERDNLSKRRFKNVIKYKTIQYDELDTSLQYYFYPLHLEPEAVVLYWADGFYTNQVKLIENVAAQLPPGVFLYVKDHPHLYGYRDVIDYDRIQSISNVRLLEPSLSGKQIIKDSKGVITINGTGGFEALLMNKHVIVFGSAFYNSCNRVIQISDIKQLRNELYKIRNVVYSDDLELYRFVLAYLLNQKIGFTDFYGGMHEKLKIDLTENGAKVAVGLAAYFNNYGNFRRSE